MTLQFKNSDLATKIKWENACSRATCSLCYFMFMARFMLVFDCQKGYCLVAVSLNDPVKTGKHGDTINRDVLSHMIWLVGWCWAKMWHATRNKHWLRAPWSQVSYKSSRYKIRLASTRLQCVQRLGGQHPFWMICQDEFVHVAPMMSPVLSQWRLQGAMIAGARRRNSLLWHLAKCVWWQMHSFNFSRANSGRSWCPKKTMPCHVHHVPKTEAKEDLIALLQDLLLPNALDPEMKVFFLKNRAVACPKDWGCGHQTGLEGRWFWDESFQVVVVGDDASSLCVKICFQHFGQRSSRELLVHGENGTEVWASTWPAQDTSPGTAHHAISYTPRFWVYFLISHSIIAHSIPLGGFKYFMIFPYTHTYIYYNYICI